MSETCVRSVGGPWHFRECGKPAKGRGDYLGKGDVPLCGVHLAAFNRRIANRDRWTRESERRESAARAAAALANARDQLVRAAVALNAAHSDIALVAPVDPTSAVVSRRLAWSDFRAAVAAYEKLAGGA